MAHRAGRSLRRGPRRSCVGTPTAPSAGGEGSAAMRTRRFGPDLAKPTAWAALAPHHRGVSPSPGHQRPAVRAACDRGLEPRRDARPGPLSAPREGRPAADLHRGGACRSGVQTRGRCLPRGDRHQALGVATVSVLMAAAEDAQAVSTIRVAPMVSSRRTVTPRASIEADPIEPGTVALSTSCVAKAGSGSHPSTTGSGSGSALFACCPVPPVLQEFHPVR